MKICLIGTVASSTINFRKTLIELLVKSGHIVYVFSTDYNDRTKQIISSLGALPVDYSLNRGGMNPIADIKDILNLKSKIKSINPDIVFSYFAKPVIYGSIAAKLAKVPRIVGMLEGLGYAFTQTPPHEKESIKKKLIRKIQIYLYKISLKFTDRVIFLNQDDPIDLLSKNNIKTKDVKILGGIGVDTKKFAYTSPPSNPVRFLFIGRLLYEKGIREYLAAASIVKEKYPETEFIVLGDIDPSNPSSITKQYLEEILERNIIIYPGHVDNVQDWIKKSSVFVLPSYREGIPCSTQEAMACGRAIITTDVPGCRETIFNNKNGLLVAPFNALDLAEKILFFIENKKYIEEFGNQSLFFSREIFDSTKQNLKLLEYIK